MKNRENCENCISYASLNGIPYCLKSRKRLHYPIKELICIHFRTKDEMPIKEHIENDKVQNPENKVCKIKLKCFKYGKNAEICYYDLENPSYSYIELNPVNVLYKTCIENFVLPLSGKTTNIAYFTVVMMNDYIIYCPTSEYEKI